jgi:hypothetical protein
VVFFKFKPEVDKQARAEFAASLRQLQQDIDVVRALEVGQNFTESARAMDLILIVDVDNQRDLATYDQHPLHQPVKQMAAQLCSESRVVDYVTV